MGLRLLVISESFKSKIEITEKSLADGNTKGVKVVVSIRYLGNFWRTIEMALINFEFWLGLHIALFLIHKFRDFVKLLQIVQQLI